MKKKLPWSLMIYLWFIILMHIVATPYLLNPTIKIGKIIIFLLLIVGFIGVQLMKKWARALLIVSCAAAIVDCMGRFLIYYDFSGSQLSTITLDFLLLLLLVTVYYVIPIAIFRMENIKKLYN